MEMDEDEEMEVELVFEAREIDLDYEFEAPMFFDFTREESIAEAREAERWFSIAKSYPPSPFVAKLVLREDSFLEIINTSQKPRDGENTTAILNDEPSDGQGPELSRIEVENRGLTFYHQPSTNKSKAKEKPNLPRSSTLMKPTASLLAKQNRSRHVTGFRFQMLPGQKEGSIYNTSMVDNQAAKRQKLDGGLLRKVGDAKQHTDFIHKVPKKEGNVDKSSTHAKLRLTIPREPDLETAHRAQRMRPKNNTEPELQTVVLRKFKARPLNRKILEAPSLPLPKKSTPKLPQFQEFHLKTLERALHHTSAVSSSSLACNDFDKGLDKPCSVLNTESGRESTRPSTTMEPSKLDGCSTTHVFKARPLNKKIFLSKGDIGVFRNTKRETTVPMEFNFHTDKRIQHNPPIDLFSKLSLASELQPNNGSHLQLPRPSCVKGSKENRSNPFQTDSKMTHLEKGKPPMFSEKQNQFGSSAPISEVGNQLSSRSLDYR